MQCTKTSLGKTTESTIKVLENAHTKNGWLTIEVETKIADFLLYVSIKQWNIKNWGIYHYLCRVLTILVRNKYAFKGITSGVIWVEILQLRRYTIIVITWIYLNERKIICKALRKKNVEMLTVFDAALFTDFQYLYTMLWLEKADPFTHKEPKDFFPSQTHPVSY